MEEVLTETNELDHSDLGIRRVYRALIRISRRLDARAGILFEYGNGMYSGTVSIGLPDECASGIELNPQMDLTRNVLRFSRVALLKRPVGEFSDFGETCLSNRLSALGSWLFIPTSVAKNPVYILLGFATAYHDLQDLTNRREVIAG